jgi:hypothetical protein
MASVFKRGDRWYAKFKDANGRWCTPSTRAETKAEAKRLGFDLERQAERRWRGRIRQQSNASFATVILDSPPKSTGTWRPSIG